MLGIVLYLCLPGQIWSRLFVSLAPVSGEGVLEVGHGGRHHRRAVLVDEQPPLRIPATRA